MAVLQVYSFGVTNGTRQGSIFSPRGGFNTYLDPMIESLRSSGYDCTSLVPFPTLMTA